MYYHRLRFNPSSYLESAKSLVVHCEEIDEISVSIHLHIWKAQKELQKKKFGLLTYGFNPSSYLESAKRYIGLPLYNDIATFQSIFIFGKRKKFPTFVTLIHFAKFQSIFIFGKRKKTKVAQLINSRKDSFNPSSYLESAKRAGQSRQH